MKKIAFCFLFLALLSSTVYIMDNPTQGSTYLMPVVSSEYDKVMKQDLLCLMMAYPGVVTGVEAEGNGKVYLVLKSGKKILYDDKRSKGIEEKVANPDLQDMLEQPYPLTTTNELMDKNFDPGRGREYTLLKEAYGGSQGKIEGNLTNVSVGYGSFQFNKQNNAAQALKSVMSELAPLAASRKDIAGAAFPSSGTYNYRVIAKTNRLSPHAFGIAIDLVRDSRDYWQWASREQGQKRLESYPKEIVEIFEKNNFVWGGKWGHFDILHFEYRPEIIMKARYFGKDAAGAEWYSGAPVDKVEVKGMVDTINNEIK